MLETETQIIESQDSNSHVQTNPTASQIKKQNRIKNLGFWTLVIGVICFIWTFVNIALPPVQALPTDVYANVTPIFSAMVNNANQIMISLTINGILFTVVSLVFWIMVIVYLVMNKGFFADLKNRLVHKQTYITMMVFMSFVTAIYLLMLIIGYVPPRLDVNLLPETGTTQTGNFSALFNWNTKLILVKNPGYWIVTGLFTVSLVLLLTSIICYFGYAPINTQFVQHQTLAKMRRDQKQAQREAQGVDKISWREAWAEARKAKKQAKKDQQEANALRQNLQDVDLNNQENASIQPEVIEIDQHGSQNQTTNLELPKIENDQLSAGVDKKEPRRLGKVFADMKDKKKAKGTNINKKATVAAPTQEINDLVKQLMPD